MYYALKRQNAENGLNIFKLENHKMNNNENCSLFFCIHRKLENNRMKWIVINASLNYTRFSFLNEGKWWNDLEKDRRKRAGTKTKAHSFNAIGEIIENFENAVVILSVIMSMTMTAWIQCGCFFVPSSHTTRRKSVIQWSYWRTTVPMLCKIWIQNNDSTCKS